MKLGEKAIRFLTDPSTAFAREKRTALIDAVQYMLILQLIHAVIGGIIGFSVLSFFLAHTTASAVFLTLGPAGLVAFIALIYASSVIGYALWSLWLHFWAYVFGARKGLEQTMKTVFYGQTPLYLFGWIPFVSIIFAVWSLALQYMGLKRLQQVNAGQAASALVVAVVVPLIILFSILAFALFALISAGLAGR